MNPISDLYQLSSHQHQHQQQLSASDSLTDSWRELQEAATSVGPKFHLQAGGAATAGATGGGGGGVGGRNNSASSTSSTSSNCSSANSNPGTGASYSSGANMFLTEYSGASGQASTPSAIPGAGPYQGQAQQQQQQPHLHQQHNHHGQQQQQSAQLIQHQHHQHHQSSQQQQQPAHHQHHHQQQQQQQQQQHMHHQQQHHQHHQQGGQHWDQTNTNTNTNTSSSSANSEHLTHNHHGSTTSNLLAHQYGGQHTIDSTTLGASLGHTKIKLDKGSDEYKKRRERNNVAVRKSREKAKMRSRETERRVAELSKENQLYRAQYEELRREFDVLKSLLLKTGLTEQVIEDEAQLHTMQQQFNQVTNYY